MGGIECVVGVTFAALVTEDCAAVTIPSCGMTNASGPVLRAHIPATTLRDTSCDDCSSSTWAALITDNCIAHTVCGQTTIGGNTSRETVAGNTTHDTVCGIDCIAGTTFASTVTEDCANITTPTCGFILNAALSQEWTLAINSQTITASAGVAVTQGTSTGTLKIALQNQKSLQLP